MVIPKKNLFLKAQPYTWKIRKYFCGVFSAHKSYHNNLKTKQNKENQVSELLKKLSLYCCTMLHLNNFLTTPALNDKVDFIIFK